MQQQQKIYRVFLSSTAKDLADYREAACKAISALDEFKCVRMEDFPAAEWNADEFCQREVAKCDLFVGIVGPSHGSCPPGSEESFTQREYKAARTNGKDRLMFLTPDDFPLACNLREVDEKYRKQQDFRNLVRPENLADTFRSPDDLARRIVGAIFNWKRRRELTGEPPPPPPLQGLRPPEPIVAFPPADVKIFKDRVGPIGHLRKSLKSQKSRLICIAGPRGIGMTALLCRLCKEIEDEIQRSLDGGSSPGSVGIAYVSCGGASKPTVERLFADLGRLLGDPRRRELEECWKNTSQSLADKVALLLGKLKQGSYWLVLDPLQDMLDNDRKIEDPAIREFVDLCLTTPDHGLRLIATSSREVVVTQPAFQEVEFVHLAEGLPPDDAIALLRELDTGDYGLREAPDSLLREAVKRCNGIPHALKNIFGLLCTDPLLSLKQLLDDKRLFGERVVENLAAQRFLQLEEKRKVDEIFVLEALAVFNKAVPEDAIRFLLEAYHPKVNVRNSLVSLICSFFVSHIRGKDSYELPDLERSYAYKRIPQVGKGYSKANCHARAADYWKQHRKDIQEWKTIDDLQPLFDEFEQRMLAKQYDNAVRVLAAMDESHLSRWGYYGWLRDQRGKIPANLIEDDRLRCQNFGFLGRAIRKLGYSEESIRHFDFALEIARTKAFDDELGRWQGELAHVYSELRQNHRAIDLYQDAVEKVQGIWKARNLNGLGVTYMNEGRTPEAVTCYQNAIEVAVQHHDEEAEADFTGNLGMALQDDGQFQKAVGCFERAIGIAQDLKIMMAQANNYDNLGTACLRLGQFERAEVEFQKGLAICEEMKEKRVRAHYLRGLADAYHHLGRLDEARRCLEEAYKLKIAEVHYSCTVKLGIVLLRQAESNKSLETLHEGIGLCSQLAADNYDAGYQKGLAELAVGKVGDALDSFRKAIQCCSARGVLWAVRQDLTLLEKVRPRLNGLDDAIRLVEEAQVRRTIESATQAVDQAKECLSEALPALDGTPKGAEAAKHHLEGILICLREAIDLIEESLKPSNPGN